MKLWHKSESGMLKSCLCTQQQLETPEYRQWMERMRELPKLHRKHWEFYFIAQALFERDMLRPGRRGLGFGVGKEPLASLFASLGCSIVATDLDQASANAAGWVQGDQYAVDLSSLNERGICPPDQLDRMVSYRNVDMRAIPDDLVGFDFLWSSCAFEHLGSLELGEQFVYRAMDCLRPGGIAVHTTEYNLGSNRETVESGGTVLYRKRDIAEMARTLRKAGHRIELDFDRGKGEADRYVDLPPYWSDKPTPHLRLKIDGFVATSIGLIVERRA